MIQMVGDLIAKMRLIKDARGKKSWTLTIVIPAMIIILARMLLGGTDVTMPGGLHFILASPTPEYTELLKWFLSSYLVRETTEKVIGAYSGSASGTSI